MTQEEKDLLLKDLCGRLFHGVICNCVDTNFSGSVDWTLYAINLQDSTIETTNGEWNDTFAVENIKPYLRPMSSMTDEEYQELLSLTGFDTTQITEGIVWFTSGLNIYLKDDIAKLIIWLNANHFDYHGLIPMGLALEAPEGMYNTKQ